MMSALVDTLERCRRGAPQLRVVSADIPTGVDGDTGQLFSPYVTADLTVCVEHIKRGLVQFPARFACGAIETVSIGINSSSPSEFRILEQDNLPALGPRRADSHKGDFGRVLVIGGSIGMPGAPILTALGALRSGAGVVSRVVKRSWLDTAGLPECMVNVLSGDGDFFRGGDAPEVIELLGSFDVVVVGPGMGVASETGEFLGALCDGMRLLGKRVVVDADAINLLSSVGISLNGIDAVITPHPGEASRMLGRPTPAIQGNRFKAVRELMEKHGVVSVLKGAGTLVYGPAGGGIVCRGTPYLATAGSGDVLAGIIAALCSRFESVFDAACLGAWAHAVAGSLASESAGGPILASDIARAASTVIGGLER
jgi:NAD(P)H-hydrate epimerase